VTACERFARWLDEGMPESAAADHDGHAASCARCAAALAAARALEAALAQPAPAAPAGFAERVMKRVAQAPLVRPVTWIDADLLPWWVLAAAEPASALAVALGALVVWQHAALARLAAATSQALGGPAAVAFVQQLAAPRLAPGLAAFTDPLVVSGLALATLPLAWWAGMAVYHWSGDPRPLRTARR